MEAFEAGHKIFSFFWWVDKPQKSTFTHKFFFSFLRPPQSESFRIYFGIFSSSPQILKRVQDDGWTVGWRTFGPILWTDAFRIQQTLHHTCLHAPETLDCRRMTSITYGAGEKLPHKTPPYTFLGNKNEIQIHLNLPATFLSKKKVHQALLVLCGSFSLLLNFRAELAGRVYQS